MNLISRLTGWMDRDWEQRRYVATFASAQKAFIFAPFILAILVLSIFDLKSDGTGIVALVVALVISGALAIWSSHRWFVGYGKTGRMKSRIDQRNLKEGQHG